MPDTKPAKKADTKLLLISWALGIALVIGYTIYWFIMSHQIEENLKAARNDSFAFSSVKVNGYPYRFTFIAKDIKWKFNSNSQFHTEEISATASTLEPQLWVLEGMLAPQIILRNNLFDITTQEFKASLRFSSNNSEIKRLSITTKSLAFSRRSDSPNLTMGNSQFHLIKSPAANEYATSINLTDVNGVVMPNIPIHSFNKFILRGIISKNQDSRNFSIKYGEIIDGLSTNLQNITGDFEVFNDEISGFQVNGILTGDIDSSLPIGKIGGENLKISIKNSQIDLINSIAMNNKFNEAQRLLDFYFNPHSLRE